MAKRGPKAKEDVVGPTPEEEAAHQARVDHSLKVAENTMTGDLRDLILNTLRWEQDQRPWNQRSETQQRETVAKIEAAVREAVSKAVELIAGAGQGKILATLESVTFRDGIKATLSLSKHDPARHNLSDATGGRVLVVVADADAFTGERAPVPITPDQGDIERVMAVHSSDETEDQTPAEEVEDETPGWRGTRDATPPSAAPITNASPLN